MINFEKTKYAEMNSIVPLIENVISDGREAKIRVTGNSMFPLLRDRKDTVRLAAFTKLKKGDVVLYRRDNGDYVLHRIIGKKGDVLTFAGDNEDAKEHPVYASQCIAKMVGCVRGGKAYDCNASFKYKLYAFLWTNFFCIRKSLMRLYGLYIKIRRRMEK